METRISLEHKIKSKALNLGFSAVGISQITPLSVDLGRLKTWIEKNYNGSMAYMERNHEIRENPALILENAQSVISVLLNYFPLVKPSTTNNYQISKYAYGIDYHYVIKNKLNDLINYIKTDLGIDANFRSFSDSAPIFDKSWAVKAGLGWIGKNSLLINKNLGSFFFVGEIITDLKLKADAPFEANHCGNCNACIESCPTHAIIDNFVVDATKCISYHTIETKSIIPSEIIEKMETSIYGCDICQDVCPWNRKSKPHHHEEFKLLDFLNQSNKDLWENLEKKEFDKIFKNSPLKRTGYEKIMQTINQIKSNVKIS